MSAVGARSAKGHDSLEELFTGASRFADRLPMLRILLERTAAACTEELAGDLAASAQLSLQGIDSGTAGDLLAAHDGSSVTGVLHAPKWGARLLLSADRTAVFAIMETMLGGDGSQAACTSPRPFTKLEMRIAGAFFERLARMLAASFAAVAETPFVLEGTGDRIDYDVIGRRNDSIVLAKFRLDAHGRGGEVWAAIPRSALNPLRDALSRAPQKELAPADPRWTRQIENELTRAGVVLSAVLDERMGLLGEIANLTVGDVLELNATAHSRVRLECNGERLIWCHLGKTNGIYTLRVDEFVDQQREFMDEIMSA